MNIKKEKDRITSDTRKFLENAMAKPKVIIGISGGKDSAVAAAICCEAIGKDNVIGIMLPDGIQKDISDSERVCKALGIHCQCHDISTATSFIKHLSGVQNDNNRASRINVPPRVRMTVLRYIAQSEGALLCGTGNYSERYVGYFTKDGDGSCDFNP